MKTIVVAPDLPPVASASARVPGIRALALHQGLQAHGLSSMMVVPNDVAAEAWLQLRCAEGPLQWPDSLAPVDAPALLHLVEEARDTAFVFNALNYTPIKDRLHSSCRLVIDFLGDLRLERPHDGTDSLARWTSIYRRSMSDADIVIVNGCNKIEIVEQVLADLPPGTTRRIADVPLALDCSPLVRHNAQDRQAVRGHLDMFIGGFLQPWQRLGAWPVALAAVLSDRRLANCVSLRIHLVARTQHDDSSSLDALARLENVTVSHTRGSFSEYLAAQHSATIVIDLHSRSRERHYAMSTRAVTSLCVGTPVIHQPDTELAPLLERYGAGFLVDPDDAEQLESLVRHLVANSEMLTAAQRGVALLRESTLNPGAAITPLVRMLEGST